MRWLPFFYNGILLYVFLWEPPKGTEKGSPLPSIGEAIQGLSPLKTSAENDRPFGAKFPMADRECRSEIWFAHWVCAVLPPNFTGSPLHHLQNLWQPHSQFVTSLSTVHAQNTKYALRPQLTHRIYTNIHDFSIYLHIFVSKGYKNSISIANTGGMGYSICILSTADTQMSYGGNG